MHATSSAVSLQSPNATQRLTGLGTRSGLTFGSKPVAGGGVGKGVIAKVSPWTSPVPVYNPDTSYGRSFNPDHGEFFKVKMNEKRNAYERPHNFQPTGDYKPKVDKVASSTKEMKNYMDQFTDSLLRFPKQIAVFEPNRQISIDPASVPLPPSPLPKWSQPHRVSPLSQANETWLTHQKQQSVARQLSEGAIIPTMNQLQLYGRREQKSK